MRILIVEDIGRVSEAEREVLLGQGHIVDSASSIARATAFLEEKSPYHCLIVDLNMGTTGLPPQYIVETDEGLLTGWVWLKRVVLPKHPELRSRTIIYSAYTADLREKETDAESLKGLTIIPKGSAFDDNESGDKLIETVKRIGAVG